MNAWDRWIDSLRYGDERPSGLARATKDACSNGLADLVSAEQSGDVVTVVYRVNPEAIERVMGAYYAAGDMIRKHFRGTPLDVSRFVDCIEIVHAHDNEVTKTMWHMGPMFYLGKTGLKDAVMGEWQRRADAKRGP